MVTHDENRIPAEAISSIFINKVIKTMHRFVIEDMRVQLEARASELAAVS
jgi:hypothetical protein